MKETDSHSMIANGSRRSQSVRGLANLKVWTTTGEVGNDKMEARQVQYFQKIKVNWRNISLSALKLNCRSTDPVGHCWGWGIGLSPSDIWSAQTSISGPILFLAILYINDLPSGHCLADASLRWRDCHLRRRIVYWWHIRTTIIHQDHGLGVKTLALTRKVNTILGTFSGTDKSLKCIPIPNGLGGGGEGGEKLHL